MDARDFSILRRAVLIFFTRFGISVAVENILPISIASETCSLSIGSRYSIYVKSGSSFTHVPSIVENVFARYTKAVGIINGFSCASFRRFSSFSISFFMFFPSSVSK